MVSKVIYDRNTYLTRVIRGLSTGNLIEVIGMRGVGKTAFLKLLSTKLETSQKYLPIFLETLPSYDVFDTFRKRIRQIALICLPKSKLAGMLNDRSGELREEDLAILVREVEKSLGKKIVVIIDDVHECKRKEVRNFITFCIRNGLKVITASLKGFFARSVKIVLKPLSKEAVRKMILDFLGYNLEQETISKIYSLTGGIPSYLLIMLQKLGVWSLKHRTRINSGIVEKIFSTEISGGLIRNLVKDYLRSYVSIFGPKTIELLVKEPTEIGIDKTSQPLLKKLKRLGLIDMENQKIVIVEPVLRKYIETIRAEEMNIGVHQLPVMRSIKRNHKFKKVFSHFTVVGENLRLFSRDILIEIAPSPSIELLNQLVKIRRILNAKDAVLICPNREYDNAFYEHIKKLGIRILTLGEETRQKFYDKGIEVANKVILEHSAMQQNL